MRNGFEQFAGEIESGLKEDAKPQGRTARRAADFEDERTSFLWYPYLPVGDYSVLMASGGTGKTFLACGLAAAVSAGKPLPGEALSYPEGKNVLMLSAEDSGGILKKRLRLSGADLNRVFILDRSDSIGLSFSEGFDEIEATIKRCKPALLIIDPWHGFLGSTVDISRVNALRPVLQKIADLAKRYEMSIVLISHVNKRSQGENANYAATGSVDFVNAARSAMVLIFDEDDKDGRILVHTKANYSTYGESVKYRIENGGITWNGFSEITRDTLEKAARKRKTPGELAKDGSTEVNLELVSALENAADELGRAKFSYSEFEAVHGSGIFQGMQPKRALDAVSGILGESGYRLRTGLQVLRGGKKQNAFEIEMTNPCT